MDSWANFNLGCVTKEWPIILHAKLLQPHFGQVWGWSSTLGNVGDLEYSGTPECLELNNKAQNTSHWGVLGVIGKVLKRRYRKWLRIGNSDLQPKLWAKERPGVKLPVWLPITKSQESTFSQHPIRVCNMALERSRWGLQLCFRPCCDQTL
jgi:hypothetical protein